MRDTGLVMKWGYAPKWDISLTQKFCYILADALRWMNRITTYMKAQNF